MISGDQLNVARRRLGPVRTWLAFPCVPVLCVPVLCASRSWALKGGGDNEGVRGKFGGGPMRVGLVDGPVFGEGRLPALDEREDPLAFFVEAGMQRVVNNPQPPGVRVLVFVFPCVPGQVRLDQQVQEQVEGVDADRGALAGKLEVDVPAAAVVRFATGPVAARVPVDAEVVPFAGSDGEGRIPPGEAG